jgi:hypothetical protein
MGSLGSYSLWSARILLSNDGVSWGKGRVQGQA